jgi:pimeloyl-ACP methyl ester carboxylesterase
MTTFVLVHGAFGGAHGWHKVRPLLWAQGHPAFTPSLTGIGERAHLTSPQVTLRTHVQDVVNCIEYEDLHDIVLVGFSYGGLVVTGCVDLIGDRIAHLVYLDAMNPAQDGASSETAEPWSYRMGQDWLVQGPSRVYDDPTEALWAAPRRSDQPIGTLREPVRISKPLEEHAFTRTYIQATAANHEVPTVSRNSEYTRTHPLWRYREIDTTHMVPNNRPDDLVKLLLEVLE